MTIERDIRALACADPASVEIEAPPELLELLERIQWFTIGTWNVITAAALCAAFAQGAFYGHRGAWSPGCRKPELAYALLHIPHP